MQSELADGVVQKDPAGQATLLTEPMRQSWPGTQGVGEVEPGAQYVPA